MLVLRFLLAGVWIVGCFGGGGVLGVKEGVDLTEEGDIVSLVSLCKRDEGTKINQQC